MLNTDFNHSTDRLSIAGFLYQHDMRPPQDLPYSSVHTSTESYVEGLLDFLATSEMLQTLCGGVHILDFMTREPDLYATVLPADWRLALSSVPVPDLLDLLMRRDLDHSFPPVGVETGCTLPPSLLQYIQTVRSLSLDRSFAEDSACPRTPKLSRHIRVGMNVKKAHEVENLAYLIDQLTGHVAGSSPHKITHLVDFGSGQNYLGRALASPVYGKDVVALESKKHNITSAKGMDIGAKLAPKTMIMRNKKAFRATGVDTSTTKNDSRSSATEVAPAAATVNGHDGTPGKGEGEGSERILYLEHSISDGNLDDVCNTLQSQSQSQLQSQSQSQLQSCSRVCSLPTPQLMVISLHSCGNLVHHGLRSLILNDSVKAVAMVGCCYNLMTERLGLPTYKLPCLRPQPNVRAEEITALRDPHGFPMSQRYATHAGRGIYLNITARMMAVQAPQNWTETDCQSFFTRHFYRALLQRIFLDRGVVGAPSAHDTTTNGGSPRGWTGKGEPLIIGSLRRACYASFVAYVRGALKKIVDDPDRGAVVQRLMNGLTDGDIEEYEVRYQHKKHELSVVWSLMAFSAGVIESAIVVDRWLWLKEQKEVKDCWVETAFEYRQSPRNLLVVGIKR